MGYEIGGRADKFGNRYEYNWAITKLVEVIEEKLSYVILEAIGKDEEGVDIWVADEMEILKDSSAKDVVAVMKHGRMEQLIPKVFGLIGKINLNETIR